MKRRRAQGVRAFAGHRLAPELQFRYNPFTALYVGNVGISLGAVAGWVRFIGLLRVSSSCNAEIDRLVGLKPDPTGALCLYRVALPMPSSLAARSMLPAHFSSAG